MPPQTVIAPACLVAVWRSESGKHSLGGASLRWVISDQACIG